MLSRLELEDITYNLGCLLWASYKIKIIYNYYISIKKKFKTNIQRKYLFDIWDKLVDNNINNRIRLVFNEDFLQMFNIQKILNGNM